MIPVLILMAIFFAGHHGFFRREAQASTIAPELELMKPYDLLRLCNRSTSSKGRNDWLTVVVVSVTNNVAVVTDGSDAIRRIELAKAIRVDGEETIYLAPDCQFIPVQFSSPLGYGDCYTARAKQFVTEAAERARQRHKIK